MHRFHALLSTTTERMNALRQGVLLLTLCTAPCLLWAVDYTWTGASSTAWELAANWSPSTGFPSDGDNVLIPHTQRVPLLDTDRTINDLTVDSGQVDLNGLTLIYTGTGLFKDSGVGNGVLTPYSFAGTTTFLNAKFDAQVIGNANGVVFTGSRFNAPVHITKTGGVTDISPGGNQFNALVELTVTGNGELRMGESTQDMYNDHLVLNCTGAGIRFGYGMGGATLAAAGTVSIGSTGFSRGSLMFARFVQQGDAAQTLALGPDATLCFFTGTVFNGPVTATAGGLCFSVATFNAGGSFSKTGASDDISSGGNTFSGDVLMRNDGAGALRLGTGSRDTFNGGAWFVRASTGDLFVGQGNDVRFRGDVSTVGSTASVRFGGEQGIMRTVFEGSTVQRFNSDAAFAPIIRNLSMATTGQGALDLLGTVQVTGDIAFTSGLLRPQATTSTGNGLLILGDDVTISDEADAASHVEGFVRKIGDDAFIFPVGREGVYAPIAISAPASATDHFTANYVRQDPTVPNDPADHDATLAQVSACENWMLERTNGSSEVNVVLSYDVARSCGVNDPARLAVASWTGAMWADNGGGTDGTSHEGTVMSAGPVTTYSEFTLALTNDQVGIEETEAVERTASVFPNPTTGEAMVVLHGLDQGPLSLTVLDMEGRQLRDASRNVRSGNLVAPLSLEGLPAGMYLVRALQSGGEATEVRVIKQ